MTEYHKIQSVYKRDPATGMKTFLVGDFAMPEFEYLFRNEWAFTEKVGGTNIRMMWDGVRLSFGGKTDATQIPSGVVSALQRHFGGREDVFREKFGETPACIYAEGYGAKIQSGFDPPCCNRDTARHVRSDEVA